MLTRPLLISAAMLFTSLSAILAADEPVRGTLTQIVSKIQRTDYEGDQAGMQKAYDELTPFVENKEFASRVRYWRGFAQWRRAINGFNDSVDPKELETDLKKAIDEFKQAMAKTPGFIDAKSGMISCLSLIGYIHKEDAARRQELWAELVPMVKEAKETAPDNPRLLWVLGPNVFISPPERGGGQDKAIEMYQKGLELIEKNKPSADPLEPSWGKPELMMNLAYSYLNKNTPDVNAAERYARSALVIVPYWHYVRDILLPQILEAKAKIK